MKNIQSEFLRTEWKISPVNDRKILVYSLLIKTYLKFYDDHLLTITKSYLSSTMKSNEANKYKEMRKSTHFEPNEKKIIAVISSLEMLFVSPAIYFFLVGYRILLNSSCGLIVLNTFDTIFVNFENVLLKLEEKSSS